MQLTVRRQTVTVMSIMALGVLAMSMLQPVVPLYLTSIGVAPEIVGLMLSVAMVGMVIGESSWGWVADQKGAKLPMTVGTFISGLAVFSFVLTQNMALIFTVFFLWGLTRSALFGPGRGYISTNAPLLRKATFMAIITMMMSASRSIGALPSGFLADNLGFHAVFFVSCGISLLAGILVLDGFGQAQPLKVEPVIAGLPPIGDLPSSVQRVSYRPFAIQCVVTALQSWCRGTVMGFLPLLATQVVGVSATKVGVLFTTYGIAIMLMSIPMGTLADRIGKKSFMTFGLVISGIAMAGIAFSPSYAWLIFFVITSGLGMATFSPAALGVISDSVPLKWQSTAMGIYGAFGENIGIIAGASVGGFIWSAWGPQYTFLLGTMTTALGTVICLTLVKDTATRKL